MSLTKKLPSLDQPRAGMTTVANKVSAQPPLQHGPAASPAAYRRMQAAAHSTASTSSVVPLPHLGGKRWATLAATAASITLVALAAALGAATENQRSPAFSGLEDHEPLPSDSGSRFNFVRVRYDSEGGPMEAYYVYDGRLWERWETDHPQADQNFAFRLGELTAVQPNRRSIVRRLTDPDLFDFPFLYFCDVGWMRLDAMEVEALREYLLRGGFLWVDDFWGAGEWRAFERAMEEVLPDTPWVELPADHSILSTLFPLEEFPQIPARDFASPYRERQHDPPQIHRQPAYDIEQVRLRAFFAEDGRLLALASLNTDIGDGWEREAYGEWFFEKFSSRAYAAGANIVLYALTH